LPRDWKVLLLSSLALLEAARSSNATATAKAKAAFYANGRQLTRAQTARANANLRQWHQASTDTRRRASGRRPHIS